MNMKDETEHLLEGLSPRGAPPHLRGRVLGAVADELAVAGRSPARWARWDVRIGMAVAASLILGLVLNIWAIRSDDVRQARLYGPDVLPREFRETVETAGQVAGVECAELLRQRLLLAWQSRRRDGPLAIVRYHQQLMQLTHKDFTDVDKDPQVDRRLPGRPVRRTSHRQRHLCVA